MDSRSRDLCSEFARILGGTSSFQNNVCIATISRDIDVTIMGRPSPTAASSIFAFNSLDKNGTALNLGEFSLLEKEVDPFIQALISQGIKVSAVKKHWFLSILRWFTSIFNLLTTHYHSQKRYATLIEFLLTNFLMYDIQNMDVHFWCAYPPFINVHCEVIHSPYKRQKINIY